MSKDQHEPSYSPPRKQSRRGSARFARSGFAPGLIDVEGTSEWLADLLDRADNPAENMSIHQLRLAHRYAAETNRSATSWAREVAADPHGGSLNMQLVKAYTQLWSLLNDDTDALVAVAEHARAWPPTFVDVQAPFIGPNGTKALDAHFAEIEHTDDEAAAIRALIRTVGDAVRRRNALDKLGQGLHPGYPRAFGRKWCNFDSTREVASGSYFVAVIDNDNNETHAYLFRLAPDEDLINIVAHAYAPRGSMADAFDYNDWPDLPTELKRYNAVTTLFLGALGTDNADDGIVPTPAGVAQVQAAMVTLASYRDLPDSVRAYIEHPYDDPYDNPTVNWDSLRIRAAWLDTCELATALRLFTGQLFARRAAPLLLGAGHHTRQSLLETAATAYDWRFNEVPLSERTNMIEYDVLVPHAPRVWQRVCAQAAKPSGALPGAARLIGVAEVLGEPIDDDQRRHPEFLCDVLTKPALTAAHRMPQGRREREAVFGEAPAEWFE